MQRITSLPNLSKIIWKGNVHLKFNVMKEEYSNGWYNRKQ